MQASTLQVGGDFQSGFTISLNNESGEGDWRELGRLLDELGAQGLLTHGGCLAFTSYRVKLTPRLVAQLDSAVPVLDGFHDWLLGQLS